jgi:hypothetical protein
MLSRRTPSALSQHVVDVVAVGAEEKVIGIDALPVVAFVKHVQPLRYLAAMQEP